LEGEEDEDDINNFDDLDEEIHSTTEYTTNDEMELESASANVSANARLKAKIYTENGQNPYSAQKFDNHAKKTIIDDYLIDENLEKEQILAAKINKFLSVCKLLSLNF
jgi:hypothetical protein